VRDAFAAMERRLRDHHGSAKRHATAAALH
jgi:hypothetical protein